MFESFSQSLGYFGIFSVIGAVFAFLYYIGVFFKLVLGFRSLLSHILDCIFVVVCGLVVMYFSVGIGTGAVRLYYLVALLLGFCIYAVSVGRLTVLVSEALRTVFEKLLSRIKCSVLRATKPFLLKIKGIFVDILQKIANLTENLKIHLKNDSNMVYNDSTHKMGKIVEEGSEIRNVVKAKVSKNS